MNGIYRHYKGGLYVVLGVGQHTETEEELVFYQGQDGRLWVRPREMFNEILVSSEGSEVERFQKVE